ncbi:MAG: nucleotide sugar dehydrogenase [Nanoarchaeota archaeon]|nr:nucleotide sugar dehydrogenase [Nanoarchaeota archaeon]
MHISIIGIGRVGLPLSLAFADAGAEVTGIDSNQGHIDTLFLGKMPFMEEGAGILLKKHLGTRFRPKTGYDTLGSSDTIVLTLGTPVDEHMHPDYRQIDSVLPHIIHFLKQGQLIILRSTVAPGTTERVKSILESKSGKICGRDFYLAYCPERIAEGKALDEIRDVPQIIGGIDEVSTKKAAQVFSMISERCHLTDSKSAELAKLYSNMFRYVNFALANEFALIAEEHGKNIFEIVKLVNEGYKRGGLAMPGFTAGPCLYKDGFFLVGTTPYTELISSSWRINENLPAYLISKMKERGELRGKNALVLGLGFKKNSDDTRNSLSYAVESLLKGEGCEVAVHDPYQNDKSGDVYPMIEKAEIIVVATNHDLYKDRKLISLIKKGTLICDIWNIFGSDRIIYNKK